MAGKPANHHGFEGAKVFDKTVFDKIKVDEMKISKVGNIEITEEEQSVFRLHPKMAIRERIEDEELDFQGELGWAKLRITLLKEEEEELDSDDDEDDKK